VEPTSFPNSSVALGDLAPSNQRLAKPEQRLGGHDVVGRDREVGAGLIGREGMAEVVNDCETPSRRI
jgi:hypothetical protein